MRSAFTAHWSWFADKKARDGYNVFYDPWSDGRPQILDESKQTACMGWTTDPVETAVDWCSAEQTEKTDDQKADLDNNRPPVMYWDVRSDSTDRTTNGVFVNGQNYEVGDSSWPPLSDRKHGGNGSMFVIPARLLRNNTSGDANSAVVKPFPAAPAPDRYPAGSWVVPVQIEPGNPEDQGPYYLRVQAVSGLELLNVDPLWSAAGGGMPWVRVYDDTPLATGGITDNPGRKPVLNYDRKNGPMWAAVVFDRQPKPDEVLYALNAAPDGVRGYRPATGRFGWPEIDWRQVAYGEMGCETGDAAQVDLDSVDFADLTGDAQNEAVIAAACPSSTAGLPVHVMVFDGSKTQLPLKNLLTVGDDAYYKSATVALKDSTPHRRRPCSRPGRAPLLPRPSDHDDRHPGRDRASPGPAAPTALSEPARRGRGPPLAAAARKGTEH